MYAFLFTFFFPFNYKDDTCINENLENTEKERGLAWSHHETQLLPLCSPLIKYFS